MARYKLSSQLPLCDVSGMLRINVFVGRLRAAFPAPMRGTEARSGALWSERGVPLRPKEIHMLSSKKQLCLVCHMSKKHVALQFCCERKISRGQLFFL